MSLVGDPHEAVFKRTVGWFESNPSLSKLRKSTHFCMVTTDQTVYKERYYENTRKVPMLRVQNAEGVVLCEITEFPLTPVALYEAIWAQVKMSSIRPILPWRRHHNCPTPEPEPVVDIPDPVDTPIDPTVDNPLDMSGPVWWPLLIVCGVGLTVGGGVGVVKTAKAKWERK
jgi:hypothetical protein